LALVREAADEIIAIFFSDSSE